MSLGYAEKLSFKADVGKLGLPELFDSSMDVQSKIQELAQLIKQSKHMVAFTGAGISTSCGIPDFRGPKGIWTLQHEGKPLPKADVPFHQARPGLTHMALVELIRADILKFIISQNIDGLHLRSGVPRDKLSELHGNSFMETCSSCGKEYFRDFEMETIGIKRTGRRCTLAECGGKLVDTIVDWEGALPPRELSAAEKNCKEADLIVCLGTSLQITPACNLPLRTVRAGGKLVIVNLQATPKDKKATLVIHARVDEVISGVMRLLERSIPPFIRIDHLVLGCTFTWTKKKSVKWTLRVESPHGPKAPLHFIESVEVEFPERPELKRVLLQAQPFVVRRETMKLRTLDVLFKLHLAEGCMCQLVEIPQSLNFEVQPEKLPPLPAKTPVDLLRMQQESTPCGHFFVADARRQSAGSHGLEVEYALVTSVIRYESVDDSDVKDKQVQQDLKFKDTTTKPAEAPTTEGKQQDLSMNDNATARFSERQEQKINNPVTKPSETDETLSEEPHNKRARY